jgi:hypothetical protein
MKMGMRVAGLALFLVLATAATPGAEQWGSIVPGESTMQEVRTRYGGPTRSTTAKTEGYDTAQWIYDGAQAPAGVRRLTIDFGLLLPSGFRPEVVRRFILEPKPGAFTRRIIERAGWGPPHVVGREGDWDVSFYTEGLTVYYERGGERVGSMIFTPPQPPPQKTSPKPSAPPR